MVLVTIRNFGEALACLRIILILVCFTFRMNARSGASTLATTVDQRLTRMIL